jgi:hypothetical protein
MADGYIGLHARRSSSPAQPAFAVDAAAADRAGTPTPASLVAGLRAFASGHGGATAVIEYAGRKGARIVLVGTDGTGGGEQFAESTDEARAACAKAGVSVEHEWERELTEQTRVSTDLWGARGRRALTR